MEDVSLSGSVLPLDYHARAWASWIPDWNGKHTDYNPSGRSFKRKELRLMAQQETVDQAGVSGFDVAATAEDLLQRAQEVADLGAALRHR
jgi:hypothetical protein